MAEGIKEFFLDGEEDQRIEKRKERKKAAVNYEVVVVSGPDFVVRRKTEKTSKILAIFPSKQQYYIKDETGGGKITMVNDGKTLSSFTMDADNVELVDENGNKAFWLKRLCKNKAEADQVIKVLENVYALKLLCKNMLLLDFEKGDICSRYHDFGIAASENIVEKVFKNVARNIGNERAKEELSEVFFCYKNRNPIFRDLNEQHYGNRELILEILQRMYGENIFEKYVDAYYTSPVSEEQESRRNSYSSISRAILNLLNETEKNEIIIDKSKLFEYIFMQGSEQGFADDIVGFIDQWRDYLRFTKQVYGRVDNKYPENLLSDERRISYIYAKLKALQEVKDFEEKAKEMKQYETVSDSKKLMIIAPEKAVDLADEGRQQSNCVASYVRYVVDGNKYIFFLRDTGHPEKSLVTIEVMIEKDESGEKRYYLGQTRARFNRIPSDEHREFIQGWFKNKFN